MAFSVIDRLSSVWKAMRHPTGSQVSVVPVFETWADFDEAINRLLIGFRGTNKNYAELAGNPLDSSLFVAAITVVGNCIIEPDLQVRRLTSRLQDDQIVEDHELVKLWNRPNAFYDGRTMLKALITSLIISDNAFLIKERNADGKLIELWYESHETIGPRYPKDGSRFISHYEQDRGSEKIRRSVEDVIHFRNGLNPMNPRVGLGTSGAILREVYADNESANWYANLMANDAAFRYFLTIDNKAGELGQEDIENIKKLLMAQVSGDNKFKAPVITNAEPKKIQFSPEELDLRAQRYGAEERFAASKGIPPEVMELGAGKQHCLPADTRISTVYRGPVAICDVKVGDEVWAFDPDSSIVRRRVLWSGQTGRKQLFKIKTKNRTIWASDNHPFLVRRREKIPAPNIGHRRSAEWRYWLEWTQVADLKVGDRILEVTALPDTGNSCLPDGTSASAHLMQWLGAFVGDGSYLGSVRAKGVSLAIPQTDRVATVYRSLTASLFSKTSEALLSSSGEAHVPYSMFESLNSFVVQSPRIERFLQGLGFTRGARRKRIPEWVFGLKEELRLAFLCGLLDTDGSVSRRGHAVWRLASKGLVYDTWHLALGLGMSVSNVYHVQQSVDRLPNAGNSDFYDSWQFTIMSSEDVRRIGSDDPLYVNYLAMASEKKRRHSMQRGLGNWILPDWTTTVAIQSIEDGPVEDVYDLTVDVAHNFIADGMIVKNSIYNNVRQAQERFTENYLCPLWMHIGHTLDNQLLPEFSSDPKEFVTFDMSQVRALQEDEKDKHKRIADDYLAGVISRFEARQALGYQPEETDKVYFVPRGGAVVPVGQVPTVMRSNEGQDANMRTSADTIEAVSSTQ